MVDNRDVRVLVAVVAMLSFGFWVGLMQMQHARPQAPVWLASLGGDFTLQSAHGDVSLHDYRGRLVLLYFGYTHCPDACPMALSVITRALKSFPGKDIAGIFVSLDPRRDTPVLLQDYTAFFDSSLVGLTASPPVLEEVAKQWRVSYQVPDAPADAFYTVEHSTFIYLINRHGNVVALFDEKTDPAEVLRTVRSWLR